jgi:glycosyltransferase involved in cell wall biosynthesis
LRILFTSTHRTSFINEDLNLLAKHFDVVHFTTREFLSLLILPWRIQKADATLTWFASVYSAIVVFIAKIFDKPSVIVVGGVDVAKCPEINYGVWLSPWKSLFVGYALRNATKVLPVAESQVRDAKRLAAYDGANLEWVPTGYDASFWRPLSVKENFVLTVASAASRERLAVKGIGFLFDAAARMPDMRFVVIGIDETLVKEVRRDAPANVDVVSFVARDDLLAYYQRARVYCQPSYSEGLPNSLCEAMLCECIPVGTQVGGIPLAIGDIGLLVPYGDVEALSDALSKAMAMPQSVGQAARTYIAESFSLSRREEALVRILYDLAP